jgi:hypothetical protein
MLTLPEPKPPNPNQPAPRSPFKNPLLYSSLVLALALLAVSWIMVSRWLENHQIEERARQQHAEKQKQNDELTLEQLGGSKLAIQSFYANPPEIRRGQTAQLCYDVANAKSVKLKPPAGEVWPSHFRCVEVSPVKDTTYTLTISDSAGKTETQSLTVRVR